jgi:hypothetical protein
MVDISKEHVAVETFKSLVQISLEGLKLLALLNGGAAVALLAYMGNIAGKGVPVPSLFIPMLCYVGGLMFCGAAFLFGFMTQFLLYDESTGQLRRGAHRTFRIPAIGFSVMSMMAFSAGSLVAALIFG